MAVYRGVVKGNVVVLAEPADLADGSVVEVRLVNPPTDETDEEGREEAVEQPLLETGFISRIPTRAPDPPGTDRTAVQVMGRPISEVIIEERR